MFKRIILIGLMFGSVSCAKNTTGSCLDEIMSQVSEDIRNNPIANALVVQMCKENNNDAKKVADLLSNSK